MGQGGTTRGAANELAFERLCEADPILNDVRAAIDVVFATTSGMASPRA